MKHPAFSRYVCYKTVSEDKVAYIENNLLVSLRIPSPQTHINIYSPILSRLARKNFVFKLALLIAIGAI
jgi:hypothetical protein